MAVWRVKLRVEMMAASRVARRDEKKVAMKDVVKVDARVATKV